MSKGLLRVKGTIDVDQFWPTNQSDADTVKVAVNPDSFEFSPDPNTQPFTLTHVFNGAMVKGAESEPAVQNGKVKIRAEHIDACELHYQVAFQELKLAPASRRNRNHKIARPDRRRI